MKWSNQERLRFRGIRVGKCCRKGGGFTLVETLLAVMLGSAAVATAAAVAVDVVGVRKHVEAEVSARWNRMRVGAAFATDLRSVLRRKDRHELSIRLPEESERLIEIHCLVSQQSTDSMFARRLPALVTYRIARSRSPGDAKLLLREVRLLTAPEEMPQTETLAVGLESVVVEVFQNGEWIATTGERKPNDAPLQAARLTCRWGRTSGNDLVRTVILDHDVPKS